jgi:hypothetical protein
VHGVSRRKWVTTTTRAPEARAAPDLVQRDFRVNGPDQLWVADITYVPTGVGFLYLAVVLAGVHLKRCTPQLFTVHQTGATPQPLLRPHQQREV